MHVKAEFGNVFVEGYLTDESRFRSIDLTDTITEINLGSVVIRIFDKNNLVKVEIEKDEGTEVEVNQEVREEIEF